jgi:hypothetical protein
MQGLWQLILGDNFTTNLKTMNKLILTLTFFIFCSALFGQTKTKIFTSDITNFWMAYDSVLTTKDTIKQKDFLQRLYFDKATLGLRDFIVIKNFSVNGHLNAIFRYSKFFQSVRPNTLQVEKSRKKFEQIMDRFRKIYPPFKQPDLFFTIGDLNSGGTTNQNNVFIGCELSTADKTVDASELPPIYKDIFSIIDIVSMVAHETVHTQQKGDISINLLTNCIAEGSADFIAEILLQKPIITTHKTYGLAHEKELAEKFEKEKFGTVIEDWLYNGTNYGYFMGYKICKSYYDNAKDKQKAIADIIELKYGDENHLKKFYIESKYSDLWK